jgi:quinol monooxygenase YgiN
VDKNKVRFVVSLAITEGKFEMFESVMKEMIAGTESEAGTLAYDWYLSGDRKRARLYEEYVDANAAEAHMMGPVVQVIVPKILAACSITGFEVYGDPGAKAGAVLKGLGAEIFGALRGVSR